ncbi:MAG: hypothetical protein WBN40_05840, partial [Pseudomonadales bacterium]
ETQAADSDGDGAPDYMESSIIDTDEDTFADQNDPENDNACVPEAIFCATNIPVMRWPHALLLGAGLLLISWSARRRRRII